jgi:flagellar protein FlbD
MSMVKLTRLNQHQVVINAEMIEFVEAIPDTIITLVSGKKLMVAESVDEVIDRIIDYRKSCNEPVFSGS